MPNNRDIDVNVADLKFDLLNPRGRGYSDPVHAFQSIVHRAPRKLIVLAEDIAAQGTSPAERMMVTKDARDERYIALEGNRRLAALKILCEPSIIGTLGLTEAQSKRLRDLSKSFDTSTVDPVSCVLFDSREEANHWIDLRHTGENDGAGVVPWDGEETARHRGTDPALQVIRYVREHAGVSAKTRELMERFPITSLGRLLGDPDSRLAMGLSIEKGTVSAIADEPELLKGLVKVISDLGSKSITVTDIKRKGDRIKYMKKIKAHLPNPAKAVDAWGLESGKKSAAAEGNKSKKVRPNSFLRKHVIPKHCMLQIDESSVVFYS